ncbi:TIGR03668 family PPOX class F420-dependent oxidoreductase [Nonomuraea sp. SBT364]|uniref:TIGR03668 family PPOX class F420-dependent oxidoreductase n=1 Tax=Nonomuraea sp. SBT364 TaxID=1580530 RepID=UPI00066A4745|nr:TIGR03668 family PPOX class F420-dependent oxidoreductase [Nonomuraea sp. SBT364]
MDSETARRLFRAARVARLGTADPDGVPHVVPVTFAVVGDRVMTAVDHKPKRSADLRRLRNIRANPHVSLLVDHYEDDWTRLWWARADGSAWIAEEDREEALDALVSKYGQYAVRRPEGPVVIVEVTRWSGWRY